MTSYEVQLCMMAPPGSFCEGPRHNKIYICKIWFQLYYIKNSKTRGLLYENSVDPDEADHYELSYEVQFANSAFLIFGTLKIKRTLFFFIEAVR